jgi:pyruvate dehydrogenase complex dehydrogenase (E1) component
MARTVLEIHDSTDEPDAEAREWVEAVSSVMAFEGSERADHLLGRAVDMARRQGARLPFAANTAYINTIPPHKETPHPGNHAIERRIRSAVRWNALAMVLRANKESSELGGHIARRPRITAATSSSSRGIPHRVSTRALSSKGGSRRSSSRTSARRRAARASPPTRIPG